MSSAGWIGPVLRASYALCLWGATYNHWAIIVRHGLFWDYGGVPQASAAFWTALSFLDPAAVILLFVRPNVGIAATVAIIVTDVVHNMRLFAHFHSSLLRALVETPAVIAQFTFMVFVLLTARLAWQRAR